MKKLIVGAVAIITVFALHGGMAFAHVAVQPNQVNVAKFQTYSVGVPVEKDMATVQVKLAIPEGLNEVTPTVKPGWTIETAKTDKDGESQVTSITWSGGSIPTGQRDDFTFSAQAPAKPTTLQWKAYQTYEDGSVVAWDQAPSTKPAAGEEEATPYSETKVVDDLASDTAAKATTNPSQKNDESRVNIALVLAVVALLVAGLAYQRKTMPVTITKDPQSKESHRKK